jgi:hypothetical protein
MITVPTVLVLGAGVSVDYGYPVGSGLIEKIIELGSDNHFNNLLKILQLPIHDFKDLCSLLISSDLTSIDSFLERNPNFTKLGKLAIAYCLIKCETSSRLLDGNAKTNGCYQHIFKAINTKWEVLSDNKLSIITFNYDRSLESYLYTIFTSRYRDKTEIEISEAIKRIPIIHVHGWLGPLDWQDQNGRKYCAFSFDKDINIVKKYTQDMKIIDSVSNQIIVVPEDHKNNKEFEDAQVLLKAADRIYFLGFGYDQNNLKKLIIPRWNFVDEKLMNKYPAVDRVVKSFKGSGYRIDQVDRDAIEGKWKIYIAEDNLTSLGFLKTYGPLESME